MNIGLVFKDLYPKFKGYAYSLIKSDSLADDLVMEVFKKLIERKESIPDDINVEAYIIRSIRNQFFDFIRKDKFVEPLDPETESALADQGSSSQVFADSNLDNLVQKLEKLGESCKSVLSLFGLGYSYKEIAEVEELPIGTVMSRMARCRANLLVEYQE